jgi:hypothetical protein
VEPKRLCNPLGNCWDPFSGKKAKGKATLKVTQPDQLSVINTSSSKWGHIVAQKGFPVSACCRPLQQNHFTGPLIYYFEITTTSSLVSTEG